MLGYLDGRKVLQRLGYHLGYTAAKDEREHKRGYERMVEWAVCVHVRRQLVGSRGRIPALDFIHRGGAPAASIPHAQIFHA